jgi:nanoRNase/pAp phosphatase (c-di-AMP/oligoRNAs hydrolase)
VACIDPWPDEFKYLEHHDKLKSDFSPNDYQAVIFVDCGDKKLTRFETEHPEILSDDMVKINIDHQVAFQIEILK